MSIFAIAFYQKYSLGYLKDMQSTQKINRLRRFTKINSISTHKFKDFLKSAQTPDYNISYMDPKYFAIMRSFFIMLLFLYKFLSFIKEGLFSATKTLFDLNIGLLTRTIPFFKRFVVYFKNLLTVACLSHDNIIINIQKRELLYAILYSDADVNTNNLTFLFSNLLFSHRKIDHWYLYTKLNNVLAFTFSSGLIFSENYIVHPLSDLFGFVLFLSELDCEDKANIDKGLDMSYGCFSF